jgi:hypothetical protein
MIDLLMAKRARDRDFDDGLRGVFMVSNVGRVVIRMPNGRALCRVCAAYIPDYSTYVFINPPSPDNLRLQSITLARLETRHLYSIPGEKLCMYISEVHITSFVLAIASAGRFKMIIGENGNTGPKILMGILRSLDLA